MRPGNRRVAPVAPVALGVLVLLLAACGSAGPSRALKVTTARPASAVAPAGAAAPATPVDPARRSEPFDPANFDESSARVDNPYLPLVPGTQLVLEGTDHRSTPHTIVSTVTDSTKVVDGVRTVVIWERDFVRRNLVEAELAFFAQDRFGNVWHLGEYSEIYEDGDLLGATGFLVGALPGVQAGVEMPAQPRVGMSYSQGFAPPPINWADRATVFQVDQQTAVPAGTFSHVLVTKESSDPAPTSFQTKYYAPGIGLIQIGFIGDDPDAETLGLTRLHQLDAAEMRDMHQQVSDIDARARMYGKTRPLERRG